MSADHPVANWAKTVDEDKRNTDVTAAGGYFRGAAASLRTGLRE